MLGILFEKQNIAFMVGLAFGVAAAANFPVLILSMYWKGLTTRGAPGGLRRPGFRRAVRALLEVGVGRCAGNKAALFPYTQPVPVRHADRLPARLHHVEERLQRPRRSEIEAFEDQYVQTQTGYMRQPPAITDRFRFRASKPGSRICRFLCLKIVRTVGNAICSKFGPIRRC